MTQKWSKRSPGNSIKQHFSQMGITGNWNFNLIARLTIYYFRNYRKSYSASWKKANSRRRRPKKTNASFASPVGRQWRPCHVSAPHERRSCPRTSLRFQLTSAGGHQVVCRRCFVKTIQSAVAQRLLPLRCVICRYAVPAPFTTRFWNNLHFRARINRLTSSSGTWRLQESASSYSVGCKSWSVSERDDSRFD